MTVGIVGLGLMGGSLAKAYKKAGGHRCWGRTATPRAGHRPCGGAVDHILTRTASRRATAAHRPVPGRRDRLAKEMAPRIPGKRW